MIQTVIRTKALEDWWMRRRVHYATREELRGFVCRPMHPRMVELAIKEIEKRRRIDIDGSCGSKP